METIDFMQGWSFGAAYKIFGFAKTVEEANAYCLKNDHAAVLDTTEHLGILIASISIIQNVTPPFDWPKVDRLKLANSFTGLSVTSMGKIFAVVEIAHDEDVNQKRHKNEGLVAVACLPDGRSIYGYQYTNVAIPAFVTALN